ncbi:uncharacterized protein M6B38_176120 [Iris pallida]|uniref:Uncharacterized protein n=1 Tax=Iris pallida TaxID=29817 RepID=A0AAX6EPW2_IRIPA|nr:uncharacterized protein M6B38_176120 [Iris pallida]
MNSRIDGWHHKMLLPAGKIILIWQILSSILTYMLEASNPPKRVLEQMEGRFSSFFCGQHEKRGKYRWIAWDVMSKAKKEGG